jgi:hypoxanthine phosphoribosyltransferase
MSKPLLQLKTTTLIDADTIAARVRELGQEIKEYYQDQPLTLITIMNGAMIFGADLARAIDMPLWMDSLRVSSYQGLGSSGSVSFASAPKLPLNGRHILLIDDILDTGLTMKKVIRKMLREQPLSIKTCVMFDKQVTRVEGGPDRADWTGFQIPPKYIVGYGLDAEEYYRNQSGISIVLND